MIELEKKEKEMIQALFTDFLREQPLSVVLSGQAGKDDFIRSASARCFPQARWPSRPRNSAENRPSIKIWTPPRPAPI